ncbi:MAG: peptidyl-prolyl cis-trans isomerase [Candidatus Altiarchaeales archaeon]|nr:peptidyl-prolyl cis-trans isomerase [Candidatus Altiarchaeales archaeon]
MRVMVFLGLILLLGCLSTTQPESTTTTTQVKAKMNTHVVLETTKGDIVIKLFDSEAPKTAENFVKYVEDGFYEGTIFHRIIPDFMIQGGGFTVEGIRKDTRPPIPIESDNGLKNNKGFIAMARTSDPDSATSQFFINTKDNDFLNYKPGYAGYTVFGEVVEGLDVVSEIESQKTRRNGRHEDWPQQPTVITKAYVKEET